MGAFYSGAMLAALAPEEIEIVGAFYNGVWKSWAHLIAGLCLQPWPQKALKSWENWNRGPILQQALGTARIKIVGTCYSEHVKSWADFIAGLGPRRTWNRGRILQWRLKIVGAFYSGAMSAALAPKGIEIVGPFYSRAMRVALATARNEIVGACYSGHLKSWEHFIAGLCLQPWPQHELKSWARF